MHERRVSGAHENDERVNVLLLWKEFFDRLLIFAFRSTYARKTFIMYFLKSERELQNLKKMKAKKEEIQMSKFINKHEAF